MLLLLLLRMGLLVTSLPHPDAHLPPTLCPAVVVGDSQAVFVCNQRAGFAWCQLPYDLAGSREGVEEALEAGKRWTLCIAWHMDLPAWPYCCC